MWSYKNYQMPEQRQIIIKGLDESTGPSMICQIKLKKINSDDIYIKAILW